MPASLLRLTTRHEAPGVRSEAGQLIRNFQAQIDALTPQYVAAQHHGFTKWQDEGVCVAEANAAQ